MNGAQMPGCESFRHDLGPYVIGGLGGHEQQALEKHLSSCSSCREDHEELAALPRLLELAREPGPEVPARVRDRVVAGAARRQGRRRWLATTVAAAAIAAVAGVVGGMLLGPQPATVIAVPLEGVEPFDAAGGWATVRTEADTLVVALDVHGLTALPDPEVYEAWLYTHDERIVSIGQLVPDDGQLTTELVAPGGLDDYRGFWITAEPDNRDPAHEGPTVLRAGLPGQP